MAQNREVTENMSRKRPFDKKDRDGSIETPCQLSDVPKRRRVTTNCTLKPLSQALHNRLQEAYDHESGEEEFIGLCAYLHVLLKWGFKIATPDLDAFICLYRQFTIQRPDLEHRLTESDSLCIPSYHQWFRGQANTSQHKQNHYPIMNEEALHSVSREYPFSFLRCEHSLGYIASRRRNDERFGPS